jgi:hypothetical protein
VIRIASGIEAKAEVVAVASGAGGTISAGDGDVEAGEGKVGVDVASVVTAPQARSSGTITAGSTCTIFITIAPRTGVQAV